MALAQLLVQAASTMDEAEYTRCDATELAALVARGEVSPAELVELAIGAIERVNPALNAVVHRMYDEARTLAANRLPDGPLRGVPMVVKDFDGFVKGAPFTASTRLLEGFVPDHDSEAIARLRRAGLVFVAKTNCPELAILGTTEPELRGPARNPYDPSRSTGGSSGGSGALVAARAVAIGHGGDGGGSLRIPANHCGLVGLKTTRARIPMGPSWSEGWGGYVQWGAVTRTVRDTAAIVDIMSGPTPGDHYAAPPLERPLVEELRRDPGSLRVAFYDGSLFGKEIDPEHRTAVRNTAAQLEALGHRIEEVRPDIDGAALAHAYFTQVAVSIAAEIDEFARLAGKAPHHADFEAGTWFMNQLGRAVSGLELHQARDAVQAAARTMGAFHERHDVLLTATVTHPQIPIGQLTLGAAERAGLALLRYVPSGRLLRSVLARMAPAFLELTPNTQLFNQTGQPAMSLPMHRSNSGLPIGIQLSAALGREDLLIRLGSQLEAAHSWHEQRPHVCA